MVVEGPGHDDNQPEQSCVEVEVEVVFEKLKFALLTVAGGNKRLRGTMKWSVEVEAAGRCWQNLTLG